MENIKTYFHEGNQILTGKEDKLKLALANFLASGHTLIEDVPGVGKTTLVKFFAQIFDLKLSRIQFTNDLLPSDIIGTSIYDPDELLEYTTDPELIFEKWASHVAFVIDGGYGDNVPSTIVDLSGDAPELIRQGKGDFDLF